jgi:Fe-S-cluster containining protein
MDSTCQRCGYCCMTAFLTLENVPIGQDDKEIAQWLDLHHCEPMDYQGRCLAVKIPLVCAWLQFDPEKGFYRCADYEHRPVLCREYQCQRKVYNG